MNTEYFNTICNELHDLNSDIDGIALVSSDGRIMHHRWNSTMDPDKIGALGAALLGLAKKAIQVINKGEFHQVVIQSSNGMLAVYSAGDQAVLIVSTLRSDGLGMLNLSCRSAAGKIAQQYATIL